MKLKETISASEIGEYVYCERAWWLRINGKGEKTDAMENGRKGHDSLFLLLGSLAFRKRVAIYIFYLAFILLGSALVVFILESLWS